MVQVQVHHQEVERTIFREIVRMKRDRTMPFFCNMVIGAGFEFTELFEFEVPQVQYSKTVPILPSSILRLNSSPTLVWSVMTVNLSGPDRTSDTKNVKMDVKTSFFDVLSEVQKYTQGLSAVIGRFTNDI